MTVEIGLRPHESSKEGNPQDRNGSDFHSHFRLNFAHEMGNQEAARIRGNAPGAHVVPLSGGLALCLLYE